MHFLLHSFYFTFHDFSLIHVSYSPFGRSYLCAVHTLGGVPYVPAAQDTTTGESRTRGQFHVVRQKLKACRLVFTLLTWISCTLCMIFTWFYYQYINHAYNIDQSACFFSSHEYEWILLGLNIQHLQIGQSMTSQPYLLLYAILCCLTTDHYER